MAPCLACHGEKGQSTNPEIPSLGAQTSPYVLIQLYLFREKLRRLDVMNDAVKGFTDDDLRTFADTISRLAAAAADGRHNRSGAHGAWAGSGTPVSLQRLPQPGPGWPRERPRVAGQREDFLVKTMREYKANIRAGYDASMAMSCSPFPTLISSISPIFPLASLRNTRPRRAASPAPPPSAVRRTPPVSRPLMLLSPLGERLGEGVMQETVFGNPLT